MERRLTTLLAADIVSFSRLIGTDEEGILKLTRERWCSAGKLTVAVF